MSDAMAGKNALLAREREAFADWARAIHGLAPDLERRDGWTLLEVVGHIAAWQRVTVTRLEALAMDDLAARPQ